MKFLTYYEIINTLYSEYSQSTWYVKNYVDQDYKNYELKRLSRKKDLKMFFQQVESEGAIVFLA